MSLFGAGTAIGGLVIDSKKATTIGTIIAATGAGLYWLEEDYI